MSVWDGFKSIFIGEDEIEQEEYASYRPQTVKSRASEEEAVYEAPLKQREPQPRQETPKRAASQPAASQRTIQRERDVEMSTTGQSSFDLVLARPNHYRDVNAIGDDLNAGKTVILNLEMVRQDDATRILDFLSGVAYANRDEIKMMAQKTYAIMPENVKFSGVDLVSELENNGYNF